MTTATALPLMMEGMRLCPEHFLFPHLQVVCKRRTSGGQLLFLPPLVMKKRGIFCSLILFTVFLLPFLAVIELTVSGSLQGSGWFWGIGVPVSVTWLFIIWVITLLFTKSKISVWYRVCICFLLSIPGQLITNYVVDLYTDFSESRTSRMISNTSTTAALLFLSVIFFLIGLNKRKTKE
jgi:hypothetical protein